MEFISLVTEKYEDCMSLVEKLSNRIQLDIADELDRTSSYLREELNKMYAQE